MFNDLFSLKWPHCAGDRRLARHRQDDRGGISQRRRRKGLHHRAQGGAVRGDGQGAHRAIWRRVHRAADRHLHTRRLRAAGERVQEAREKLDILVNNAGAAWGAEFDEFPESGWDKVMNLNVKAPFS